MIKVQVVREKTGNKMIKDMVVSGHAYYDEPGKDIICAYVSGIMYTTIGALDELAGINNYIERNGYMRCSIPVDITEQQRNKAEIIMETAAIGLKQLERQYGEYISIHEKEV